MLRYSPPTHAPTTSLGLTPTNQASEWLLEVPVLPPNSVAVRLGQEMGIKRIIETAHKMGVDSKLDDTPSLALGSSDMNLLELADSYCTVADNGRHHAPVLVTRIVDRDGKEVYRAPEDAEQVIPYKSAFFMQQLLKGGMMEPGGTSQSLWGYVGQ